MRIKIDLFPDGLLFGFTYYPKSTYDEFDFTEINIYLLFCKIHCQWNQN